MTATANQNQKTIDAVDEVSLTLSRLRDQARMLEVFTSFAQNEQIPAAQILPGLSGVFYDLADEYDRMRELVSIIHRQHSIEIEQLRRQGAGRR